LSQSAVSKQIAELEDATGVLFERIRKRLSEALACAMKPPSNPCLLAQLEYRHAGADHHSGTVALHYICQRCRLWRKVPDAAFARFSGAAPTSAAFVPALCAGAMTARADGLLCDFVWLTETGRVRLAGVITSLGMETLIAPPLQSIATAQRCSRHDASSPIQHYRRPGRIGPLCIAWKVARWLARS
jgi:hypothetical protein